MEAKQRCLYIVGSIYRPGCLTFAMELEHEYYPPSSAVNELFNMLQTSYSGIMYYIIEIPSTGNSMKNAEKVATGCNLVLKPGKPYNGKTEFPVNCSADCCFTLETLDHDILYDNDIRNLVKCEIKKNMDKYDSSVIE